LYGVAGEGDGAEGCYLWVDSSYTCDEEVGRSEVEEWREDKSGNGGGGIYLYTSFA